VPLLYVGRHALCIAIRFAQCRRDGHHHGAVGRARYPESPADGGRAPDEPRLPSLARQIGTLLGGGAGLEELTLTTNGTRLGEHAATLFEAGIRRINVSLDTLDAELFQKITRRGRLSDVLKGIDAACSAGLSVKINMVALKGLNEQEFEPMLRWCMTQGHDLTLIETMPIGVVDEDRTAHYLPLDAVEQRLISKFQFSPSHYRTGGPARYFDHPSSSTRLGFITPFTRNFCESCNRIRLTAEGHLAACLGHEDHVDLGSAYRSGGLAALDASLDAALRVKPRGHEFQIGGSDRAAVTRHMNVTGG
jgi:cyclic pyranopterin phosphate synthase